MAKEEVLRDIKESEEKILREERKIEVMEQDLKKDEQILEGVVNFRERFVKKISKHKTIYSLLVATGVVLVWRGIWDLSSSLIASSAVALVLGLIVLWLINRYTDLI